MADASAPGAWPRYWGVPTADQLRALAVLPIPAVAALEPPGRELHRDLYLDTPDAVLRARGVTCRLRISTTGRTSILLEIDDLDGGARSFTTAARSDEALQAVGESNSVTRRLRAIVDPSRLVVRLELEVERLSRVIRGGWLRRPRVRVHYDVVRVRRGEMVRCLQQVTLHAPPESHDGDLIRGYFDGDAGLRPAEATVRRAELLVKWLPHIPAGPADDPSTDTGAVPDQAMLHPEISFLASQARVLAMAEDPRVPLAERLRFIAIVAANLDEFFMVRVAGMKVATPEMAEEATGEWGDPGVQLRAVAVAVRSLQSRHGAAARACLAAAARWGVRLRRWDDLSEHERVDLTTLYREEIHPALTPLAMTMSPGHPFPRLPHLALSMAVMLKGSNGGGSHFAEVEIPDDLPRLVPLTSDDASFDVVPLEEVIRANLGRLYPDARIAEAHCFRVTRASVLAVDEAHGTDLLQAMDDATRLRAGDIPVRVEVDAAMGELLRELVRAQVRREAGDAMPLSADDVYSIDGLLDLRVVGGLRLPADPGLRYPPLHPVEPVPPATTMFDAIAAGELLVHHPFESFDATVVRFIREAASDPAVTTIRMTLYRVGDDSPIVDALRSAARKGKQVYAFVELRARFDEARNVKWVRALEKAGVHVVYGLVGLKTHAKAALVVRREGSRLRSYVHVGTGNYNARTGLAYTDLSLFTSDAEIVADIGDLFNSLTGSSDPLERRDRRCLIAPAGMLAGLIELIDREAAHARAGRPAAIRIKVNGLSDGELIAALERAAADGVRIDLVVRGICTLRPAPEGSLNRIRVVSNTGRFLEHSRVYYFGNGGAPLYFIGSADLRPRNIRRRVEVLAPVTSEAAQARLDRLLYAYVDDARGWELHHDGSYVQRSAEGPGVQDMLLGETSAAVVAKAKWEHALNGSPR
ncbi:MAG: polyphosphate kinase 1 [Gemmatimonadaceae bacterium]|nr:polyphosphate kinase 1 [Gemmatimonadaceae bacterium]